MDLKYDRQGLIPTVAQEASSGDVLMVAWMNRAALSLTQKTGRAHFWSRSRGELWEKGKSSGGVLHVREIFADCDGDTLLLRVDAEGAACHTGASSCFFRKLE